jgi:hypothetical protein
MWNQTVEERKQRLLKVVQKWLEFRAVEHEELDEDVVQIGYSKALENSEKITSRLGLLDLNEKAYITAWVEVSYLAGFIAGWRDYRNLKAIRPKNVAWVMDLDGFTREDWAAPYANKYAFDATKDIFDHLLAPPVSPLVSNLEKSQLDFLRETTERSLFTGFLGGLEQAFSLKGHNLSTISFNYAIEALE